MLRTIGIYGKLAPRTSLRTPARFNSTAHAHHMNWVEFFKLRKENKRINVAASAVTSLVGAFTTLQFLGNHEIDVEQQIWGMDPIMILGGIVVIGGVAGYLVGPSIGVRVFNMKNSRVLPEFMVKEQQFLQRVHRHRVDPSSQSFSNPVPDYYGERIYSLDNYKQWLRDCHAFRRKTQEFL
ncbi:hypothetical protein JCM33374_g6449 [Metschnikowia sp. JCM 33374]|nr:hypothetical protein JCM33374_g6449 [Metschnikowia sp. JCM 33374]